MIEETFRTYFEAFTGDASWDDIAPHFEKLFHDDLIVVTPNGEVDKAGWAQAVKSLLDAGVRVSVGSMRENGNTIYYSATIAKNDGTSMKPGSKGYVRDGKLVRVEPMLPTAYAKIMDT